MKLKPAKLQIVDTEKRYYNNLDHTESGLNTLWTILLTLLFILILIIVFIICQRYIYGQIIYFGKRCLTRRNDKSNVDGNFSVIQGSKSGYYMKRRLLWPDTCNFSKFHIKYGRHRHKEQENKCKLRIFLQEKKKLLAPRDNKILTSNSNIELTKQLSLEMTCSSLSSNQVEYTYAIPSVSKGWSTVFSKGREYNTLGVQNTENICRNTHGCGKDICFSDTDLRFVTSLRQYNSIKDDEPLLWKWKSGNIITDSQKASSKLIRFKYNMDLLKKNTQVDQISTFKSSDSPRSWIEKAVADSKYFPNSGFCKSHISTNMLLKQLKRSTNFCYSSTESETLSNTINAGGETLSINLEVQDNQIKIDKLRDSKLQIPNESAIHTKKIKSSIEILKNCIKDVKNPRRTKSNENFVNTATINHNISYLNTQQSCTSAHVIGDDYASCVLDTYSEISDTYNELGILCSQYIKLQTHPCHRKYCALKRHLRNNLPHSTRKCQIRFNYHQMYPYDQRPTCNSGNICSDTYDELKLMCTSQSERMHIYQSMFKRRKHFLNQPYILPD